MNDRALRIETDEFGDIDVPAGVLWGAQTARSLRHFAIGTQRMPLDVIHAIAWIKWAAALVHGELGVLPEAKAHAVAEAALRVAGGQHDDEFPLSVWQTGSGTQSHMNVNEVIARLASRPPRGWASAPTPIDPHEDVNRGQSTNDVFPTAMHVAVALRAKSGLLPALAQLHSALADKAEAFADIVKIGRTHLQDATPLTLGQAFGGYAAQLALCDAALRHALGGVHALAIGGTAVGTGYGAHPQFGVRVAARLAERLDLPLVQAGNLFAALAGHEALVALHAALRMLAIALTKIGCDIRLLGSGPRAGLGELLLPANEPGSSFMPGKVNPTQVEALTMVCAQVIGHDAAVGFAASQGQLELNAYKPLIALNLLDSLCLLTDAMYSFSEHAVCPLRVDTDRVRQHLQSSLMLATALVRHIGHDRTARVVRHAQEQGCGLREAALALGAVSGQQFDAWVDARQMLAPGASGTAAGP
jgi:fumarate hydratase, class II